MWTWWGKLVKTTPKPVSCDHQPVSWTSDDRSGEIWLCAKCGVIAYRAR